MRFAPFALAAGISQLAFGHPLEKRQGNLSPVNSATDESVLQLALYLEHLEQSLYTGGFNNFTDAEYTAAGFPPGFRENVGIIAEHETVHASTIEEILKQSGYTPVPPCLYTFPYTDPVSFVDLANMITSVGIGAYLGGSTLLVDDPRLEVAAASILTVEARHDAYLRAGVGGSPFPTSFDTAITAVWAYNLAQMFIVHCPQQLPLTILPKLKLTAPAPQPHLQPAVVGGTELTFTFDPATFFVQVDPNAPLYIAFINQVTNTTFVEATKTGTGTVTVPLPDGLGGAAFAVLSTFGDLNEDQLSSFGTLAGPAEIIIS